MRTLISDLQRNYDDPLAVQFLDYLQVIMRSKTNKERSWHLVKHLMILTGVET